MHGGVEAIYDDVPVPVGMMKFATVVAAQGTMFSARRRLQLKGKELEPVTPESDLMGVAGDREP